METETRDYSTYYNAQSGSRLFHEVLTLLGKILFASLPLLIFYYNY